MGVDGKIGRFENLKIGRLENWNFGIMEYWNNGKRQGAGLEG